MNNLFQIPDYVYDYCKNRQTEITEYLTIGKYRTASERDSLIDSAITSVLRKPGVIRVIPFISQDTEDYFKVVVIRKVLPLTVMKSKLLLRAAELESKTCRRDFPISLQEARYILIDEFGSKYPDLNTICQPLSVLNLIRERRNQCTLDLVDTVRLAEERRAARCIA
jgi:hypothetical protein